MKNLWIHTENAFVTWIADFTAIADRPVAILDFVRAVLASGSRHRIFDVVEAPLIDYRRDRDGLLGDVLLRLLEREHVLDLFGFTGSAMMPGRPRSSTVETALSYYDRSDQLIECAVTDLGAVLESLEPVPGCIAKGFMTHYPALRIRGRRYADVHQGVPVDLRADPLPVAVLIAIHSDIWFPWVFGSAHPLHDYRRMFDNRELANRHTPRLNAFLGEVAAAARRVGGSFGIWPDGTGAQAIDCVDDESVLLDWTPPNGIMPPEALEVEWG
jgi:hypothetical protein